MSDTTLVPDKVHLVGSIGLDSVVEVLNTCGTLLGRRLKRIPDGEPGGRRLWISWQAPLLRSSPFLQLVDPKVGVFGVMRLADGVRREEVRFGELGYCREARASYLDYLEAKKRGEIPEGVRFQVALPTPYAVMSPFIAKDSLGDIEPAYTEAMLREVKYICDSIPHQDLCIQWDVCLEMVIWDGSSPYYQWPYPGEDAKAAIIDRIRKISDIIPADVELGYHLCYGDFEAKHFFDPTDMGAMVEISNAIVDAVDHPVSYIHMPVPIARDDDDFYKPLDGLRPDPGMDVYLGVVHVKDGLDGLKRRVAAASRHLPDFGISTECGMARSRTAELIKDTIKLHAAGSKEPA